MKEFDGRIALITGGNSGIGQATAVAFARKGVRVVVAARRVEEGNTTVEAIRQTGGIATFVQTDVTKAAQAEAMVQQTVATYGRLDYAFNNAGIAGDPVSTVDCSEENWDRVMNVNLKGVWLCMKYQIRQMLRQEGGVIVNNSSTAGLRGSGLGQSAYSASKHGVIGLTRSAAREFGKAGIRINAICPSLVRTQMIDGARDPNLEVRAIAAYALDRIGSPEDIAEAVLWLCSERASFVTGIAMPIDGGSLA
jgi:NAD(P)-dependent dehydrogenase (short-subunit alcohol dehydrogenase family)